MSKHYIEGANDGIKRALYFVPAEPGDRYTRGYSPAMLELTPGQWVRQIVALDRVKTKPEPGQEAA